MRRLRIALLVLLAALPGCALTTSEPQGNDAVIWAPTPVDGSKPGYLHAITAISPDDIWAVGRTSANPPKAQATHWDGTHWTQMTVPSTKPGRHNLLGVAALAKNDIWAVGGYEDSSRATYALIAHSDGTSWEIVAGPDLASDSYLSAVVAVSANDVWAVGSEDEKPLIMHWNGKDWSRAQVPVLAERSSLSSIAAVSAQEIWAVGATGQKMLILHWDGSFWSRVPSPGFEEDLLTNGMWRFLLSGVAAITSNDVWAVGLATEISVGNHLPLGIPLAMHWDGNAWTMSDLPDDAMSRLPSDDRLLGVAAVSADDVWAVGGGHESLLVMHWDGKAWRSNPCPTKALDGTRYGGWLESVVGRPDMEPLAVGTIWKWDESPYNDDLSGSVLRPANGACPTPTPFPTQKPWPTPIPVPTQVPKPTPSSTVQLWVHKVPTRAVPIPIGTPGHAPMPLQTYVPRPISNYYWPAASVGVPSTVAPTRP
jgi:hypothetical protein